MFARESRFWWMDKDCVYADCGNGAPFYCGRRSERRWTLRDQIDVGVLVLFCLDASPLRFLLLVPFVRRLFAL